MRRSDERLLRLVDTLVDFSRIEADRLEAIYLATDLAAFTSELVAGFRCTIEKAGLKLTLDCPELAEPAFVDRGMWEKIVLNLLSNAFKFTFEGKIAVRLRAFEGAFELAVEDTGIGIPQVELPRVFERFRRIEGARSRAQEGTGIGLALVEALVKLHGGTVRAESVEGRGSTFTVAIKAGQAHLPKDRVGVPSALTSTPAGAEASAGAPLRSLPDDLPADTGPGSDARAGVPAGSPRARLLVVEDDPDLREYLRRLLSPKHEVEAVAFGEAALRSASARRPDLLLADIVKPGLDGLAFSRKLRADPILGEVPLILLSAGSRAEARVRAREEHLRAVVETTPECVKIVDRDGRLLEMNRSGLAMVDAPSAEFVVGKDICTLIAPEHRDAFRAFNRRICSGERGTFEFDVIGLQGVRRHMETHAAPLTMPDGNIVQLALTRDVSAQRNAEEALRESDRRKDEFMATLAHELRNPLAPLRNALTRLRLSAGDDHGLSPLHEMMERQVNHLVRLVDDLLEMSRIDRGLLELKRERIELASVLRSAVEASEPIIREGGHALEVRLPAEPLWVLGDAVRLGQVVANLLDNAARFTRQSGHITLAAQAGPGVALISVRDTGEGFSPERASRLFQMWSKGDRSSGLGIGLALSRRLVELHGGAIAGHSAGEGRGAEFVVRLPLDSVERAAPSPHPRPGGRPEPLNCRVLIADDNRDAADSLAELLRLVGGEVAVAYDGAEAVEIARVFHPDVALLDIGMPKLDGYEVARCIRREGGARRVKLVAVTGWGQADDRRRAREAGFDEHLVKPAELGALRALLYSATRRGSS